LTFPDAAQYISHRYHFTIEHDAAIRPASIAYLRQIHFFVPMISIIRKNAGAAYY
jgi:hypothetical protein